MIRGHLYRKLTGMSIEDYIMFHSPGAQKSINEAIAGTIKRAFTPPPEPKKGVEYAG